MSFDEAVDEALATYNMSRSKRPKKRAEQSPYSKTNGTPQSRFRIFSANSAFDSQSSRLSFCYVPDRPRPHLPTLLLRARFAARAATTLTTGQPVSRREFICAPKGAAHQSPQHIMATTLLDSLEPTNRVLKRAQYEAFEFSLLDGDVRVRNESHQNPADHEYRVTVVDGVPETCECPADTVSDGACKHRVAVAIRPKNPRYRKEDASYHRQQRCSGWRATRNPIRYRRHSAVRL